MSDHKKTITVGGKTIDYGSLSNEQLLKLYDNLLKRNNEIVKKINSLETKDN